MKNICCVIGLAVWLVSLPGCDRPLEPEAVHQTANGSVVFQLSKSLTAGSLRMISITLQREGYSSIADSVILSSQSLLIEFPSVPIGIWQVFVIGYDSLQRSMYYGEGQVDVKEEQTSSITIALVVTGGYGAIQVGVVIATAPPSWDVSSTPVLSQTAGTEDANQFYFSQPAVLKVNNEYKMWYATGYASSLSGKDTVGISYAVSSNGTTWTKKGPIQFGSALPSWAAAFVQTPCALYENGVYKLWFEGGMAGKIHNGIGYATSSDGIHWTVRSTPVIPVSADQPYVFGPSVLHLSSGYRMYYNVEIRTAGLREVIYAVNSFDGITWTSPKQVMERRSRASWDGIGPFCPKVIYDEGKYLMSYSTSYTGNQAALGYAESSDGISWHFFGTKPDLSPSDFGTPNIVGVAYSCIMKDGGKMKMWYSMLTSSPYRWQIGYGER